MNSAQIQLFLHTYNEKKQDGHQRDGQALMNALYSVNPDLYQEITGTDADPFYDDNKIEKFWNKVF